ncbi:MAG: DUF2797 domain-containing protein [Candidatus Heimdallarchaeota archaeon]|nr:DUF2797 domain-containing protein [Candidatus Heimdallarchaeota archaeon]
MKKFVIHTGWKLKPKPTPYILYIDNPKENEEKIFELNLGKNLNIEIDSLEKKFCIGYNTSTGERIPCPYTEEIANNRIQCQSCSLNEFYTCRVICQGDFCHPSSEEAKKHCWETKANVYLTHIAGKVKVGSSTSPFRRWLDQGSDAGVCIAEGVGLEPRAVEYRIGLKLAYPMAIRINQKMKLLGKSFDQESIINDIKFAVNEVYDSIQSDIMIPKEKLLPITLMGELYGEIPLLETRPLVKKIGKENFHFSGKIVGIKGSIVVVKNEQTYYAFDLHSLIGRNINISDEKIEMKGQRSLFDFV